MIQFEKIHKYSTGKVELSCTILLYIAVANLDCKWFHHQFLFYNVPNGLYSNLLNLHHLLVLFVSKLRYAFHHHVSVAVIIEFYSDIAAELRITMTINFIRFLPSLTHRPTSMASSHLMDETLHSTYHRLKDYLRLNLSAANAPMHM